MADDVAITLDPDRLLVPPTWVVIECENGCRETWTVDAAEFDPPLNIGTAEDLLRPSLVAHRCSPAPSTEGSRET